MLNVAALYRHKQPEVRGAILLASLSLVIDWNASPNYQVPEPLTV